jgi:SET domain
MGFFNVKAWSLFLSCIAIIRGRVNGQKEPAEEIPLCRLYLAPSYLSTDDSIDFGLFAGPGGFSKDELIPSFDMAIPLFDYLESPSAKRSDINRMVAKYIERNTWIAEYAGAKLEANHSTSAFMPGLGSLSAYHTGYYNVDWYQPGMIMRDPDAFAESIRGKPHPSRGAITTYYNSTMKAAANIPPGMELFSNHGIDWDESAVDVYQEKITRRDYESADKVVDRILNFMKKHESKMDDKLRNDILDFMLDKILLGTDGKHSSIIRSLIPDRPDKLQEVKDIGGTFLYRNKEMIRSQEWLKKRGLCVDNLVADTSTVPDAGRGAFARRPVGADEVISPVPLLPILYEEVIEVYNETREIIVGENGEKQFDLDTTKPPKGFHMMYNYCFGNAESNLLLCPTAPMVNYINHAPTKDAVNAYFEWSKHDYIYNGHNLQDRQIQKWNLDDIPHISLMLKAKRDIKMGEEIFIDYGDEWEKEWKTYKEAWEAKRFEGERWTLAALDLRQPYKDKPYPVDIKPGQEPYPHGVVTGCFVETTGDIPDGRPRRNAKGQRIVQWKAPLKLEGFHGRHLAVCDLLNRTKLEDGTYEYHAMMRIKDRDLSVGEVANIPHQAITLVDRPYISDIHLDESFRRWIALPDQMFPQEWRNLRN